MSQNQREYVRLNLNCRVFVELEGSAESPSDSGRVALCETLDISYGGLKVGVNEWLSEGTILPVGVEISWLEQTLHLIGEVKWCRNNDAPGSIWSAGIQLLNSDDTDIAQWRELLLHV